MEQIGITCCMCVHVIYFGRFTVFIFGAVAAAVQANVFFFAGLYALSFNLQYTLEGIKN